MFKKIILGLVALVIIVAIAAGTLWSNLDSIVKTAVEKVGTAVLQTEVSLSSVKISLTSGQGSLSGLSIANPKGFSSAKAFYLGAITLKIDPHSIAGTGPIIVKELTIEKPQVSYEIAQSGDNLQTLQKNATTFANTAVGVNKNAKEETPSAKKEGRKLIIEHLAIRDGQVGISHYLLAGKNMQATLPTITLSNLGKDSGGITPAVLAEKIMGTLTASATAAATADITKQLGSLKNITPDSLKGVGNQLKGLLGR